MKNKTTRIAVIFACLIVLVVGYYAYLSNKAKVEREEATTTSIVQSTLSRDLQNDYPPTPKEVIKYFNELMKCVYNENCSKEELKELGDQARKLYDQELLDFNEPDTYFDSLSSEVQEYKERERRITSISLASSANVKFFEEDGHSFARIMCSYNVMEKGMTYVVKHMYLLRMDDEKHWKIYGWEPAEEQK